MKYLKLFKIHSDYEEYINGEAVLPNVSYTEDERGIYYNPWKPHDYSQDYFTMRVTVGGDITWTGTENNALYYSKDNGKTWSEPSVNITLSVNKGDKVLWKGETSPTDNGIGAFNDSTDVRYTVEGNIMSLLFGDDFKTQTSLEDKNYVFFQLFYNNKGLTSAENLSLPATTLAGVYCYGYMFDGCTSLTTAPELPATTLAGYCYSGMFNGCTSLTTAPELPVTTLANDCYSYMFNGCTSLTTAPELPATTLAYDCYGYMFHDCTSLVTAPELPATTLADFCYQSMFYNCTSLVTAPELPATTLAFRCYEQMFRKCTSLVTAPELPATTLANDCYSYMFDNCTKLNYIKCLATDISVSNSCQSWVSYVASTGTFVKPSSMTSWSTDINGIPTGWTVVDA